MTGSGVHTAGAGARGADRLLRYGAVAAGVVAAAAIALAADDPRSLRLGVLAALWAALLAAFAVVRLRRASADGAERAETMRAVYRLELEREVLARREYELTVERDVRKQVERDSRDELEAVRAELHTLRETLSQLLGGDLLVERVALRAESTRVRSLAESHQQPAARWRPDAAERSTPLPCRDPDARTDPTLRRPNPQAPEPLEPAAQLPGDPTFGDPGITWGPSWRAAPATWDAAPEPPAHRPLPPHPPTTSPAHSTPWPLEPLVGTGGRHQETRRPTASQEGNGSGGAAHRVRDVPSGPRSVDDLVAAYGVEAAPRRRHRRAD